jgi:hypothetical protein
MPISYREQLSPLCDELAELALEIIAAANNVPISGGFSDPKVLAIALTCRTRSNFLAGIILLKAGHAVEARTLARCCFENMFLIGGLYAEGTEFVRLMKEDDEEGRRLKAKVAHDMEAFENLSPAIQLALEAFMQKNAKPKGKLLAPKTASRKSDFREAYIAYSQLSSDAAHPSLSALKRYITAEEEDGTAFPSIDVVPTLGEHELNETMHFLVIGFLGALVGLNQILGATSPGKKLAPLAARFKALESKLADGVASAMKGDGN